MFLDQPLLTATLLVCFRIDRRLKELGGFWADEFGVPELGEGEGEGARGSGLEDIFKAVMKTERDGVA